MFAQLSERLQGALRKLRGKGRLTEGDVDAALREVRLALLEADVHFRVVKSFIARVRERAVGEDVMASLTPGQQVVKIVHDELTALMGEQEARLNLSGRSGEPAGLLLAGLQGAGKTTAAAKLARRLKAEGRRPLLIGADVHRPAAAEQLQRLAGQIEVPFFSLGAGADPVRIVEEGRKEALRLGCDVMIVDTAGRLHIDDSLMEELGRIDGVFDFSERLLVIDAMTGQDALQVATAFGERLALTGLILTKLDGDARGGAALSARSVTGSPIKFVGVGEKLDALEVFHPERMASRILGMGDVMTLIERAQERMDASAAERMMKKLRGEEAFDLEDFREQLKQVRSLGPLEELLGMIPGMSNLKGMGDLQLDERELKRVDAIISSMTPEERRNPAMIDGGRRRRIAQGSGTRVQDVNRLLKQFEQTRSLMKQFGGGVKGKRKKRLRLPSNLLGR